MIRSGRATEALFLACAFCITWEKIHWSFGGNVAKALRLHAQARRLLRLSAPGRRQQRRRE